MLRKTLVHCWWECKLVQLLWKPVWTFLIKNRTIYDPAISLLGINLKKMKPVTWIDTNTSISCYICFFFFFNNVFVFYLFIYLWLCWVFVSVWGPFLVAASGGRSSSRCAGLPLSRPLLLWNTGSRRAGSAIVAHGPSCSAARGILPDQGSNPCPLHWQADSQPLRHQGGPGLGFNADFKVKYESGV